MFGLHRFVVYGITPFEYLGTLQLNAQADTRAVLLAIKTLLCHPHGACASFCGWGRASTTLCLRHDDVSMNDIAVVVIVSLERSDEMSGDVITSIVELTLLNRGFDRYGTRALFSILDVTPLVNWVHVLKAHDLDVMFYCPDMGCARTQVPPGAVRAILENLICEPVPERIPGLSIVDSPWLDPFLIDGPGTSKDEPSKRPRQFSSVALLENSRKVLMRTDLRQPVQASQVSPTIHYSPGGRRAPITELESVDRLS
jgi:hypothetical protein